MQDCKDSGSALQEISLGALMDRLRESHHALGHERVPTDGTLELTRRCNLRCVHCYIGDARWTPDPNQLSTEEVKHLLDALFDRGTVQLKFTGGEAMIRPDFRELWLYAKSKGFLLTLFSNAVLIDDEMADFLSAYPPQNLEVSIYGATKETFEKITLNQGGFERFLGGIERIRARGLPWILKTVLIDGLVEELPLIRELAARWGVKLVVEGAIIPSLGEGASGGRAPCATRLPEERIVGAELTNLDGEAFGTLVREEMLGCAQPEPGREEHLFGCGAGANMFHVTADGNAQMCIISKHRAESLRAEGDFGKGFDRAWKKFGEARELKLDPASPCHGCDIAGLCKSCPSFAHLEHGDEHAAVEWLCRSTHLMASRLGLPHRCDVKHFVYTPPGAARS